MDIVFTDSTIISKAVFSEDKKHRYYLKREWNRDLPMATFILLNPTEADALKSDRTLMTIMNFLADNDYGGFNVVNLFSLRANRESGLKKTEYNQRHNKETDEWIKKAAKSARKDCFIAWGSNKDRIKRIRTLINIFEKLKINKVKKIVNVNGRISHLAYISNDNSVVEIDVNDILDR